MPMILISLMKLFSQAISKFFSYPHLCSLCCKITVSSWFFSPYGPRRTVDQWLGSWLSDLKGSIYGQMVTLVWSMMTSLVVTKLILSCAQIYLLTSWRKKPLILMVTNDWPSLSGVKPELGWIAWKWVHSL